MEGTPAGGELGQMGPVARMMISVAGHAITSYVQFRALAELLIARGLISREELESQFSLMRERQLDVTIDEWFTPDIAYHLKMAIHSAMAEDAAAGSSPTDDVTPHSGAVAPPDADDVARARAMQDGQSASEP